MTPMAYKVIEQGSVLEMPGSMPRPMTPVIEAALTEHYYEFRRYLLRRVGNPATAEDVLQNFCVRVINSGAGLRNSESVIAWLYTVLRSVLTDHYRSAAVQRRREDSYASDQMVTGNTQVEIEPDESACDCLHKVMPEMRSDYAEILRRMDLSDEPRQRVADDLGITPANARVRLHRARQALRKSLNAFCNGCADHKLHDCACQPMRVQQSL